jgi:manganese/zinc/iron transport system permease protein
MIDFFTDPVLRAPTWGCILMCVASSLMGVLIFLRKKSLLSESLSHATYPGACLGVAFLGMFFPQSDEWTFLAVLIGAFISSLLGLKAIHWLEEKGKVKPDAALCFVLAVFFGMGIVIASAMQAQMPLWHKQTQMLLFGQAATMSDIHIWIYGSLALTVAFFLFLTFRPLQASLFDRDFALSSQIPVLALERILFWLLLLSLIVGIRSVGVVLLSGMVIAPAVAARQFTDRLQLIFILAASFGGLSGLMGNCLSVWLNVPTGPMIVLTGTTIALGALFLAPKRGLLFKIWRIWTFHLHCLEENILKAMWKKGAFLQPLTAMSRVALWRLKRQGWIHSHLQLTEDGRQKAASIVRLHRLFELYLTEELGYQAEKVHRTAEEMEHIITPEMEERLTHLLEDPQHDPHDQPIPKKRGV